MNDGNIDLDRQFREEVVGRLARIEAHVDNLPSRVAALERWRNYIVGALSVIGAALGYLGQHYLSPIVARLQ